MRGAPRIHVRATYPLEDVGAAHRDVESGHGRGKVVLSVGRPSSRPASITYRDTSLGPSARPRFHRPHPPGADRSPATS
ncbi:zinc-binding dehydrogenase [Streptomyces sp. CRN 30]|uniref:zinc-binding dehydrogenase n=1 Tax=Streptomyces sp. CRN 30 TaxID=3075613 RepID=UPI002A7F1142|nr:zinc-binding dehydrogenase [Streptomyces sp. CRN 30]